MELKKLEENSSSSVAEIFKEQFSRRGIPEKTETDNAPQFTSYEFHHFPFDWEFTHLSSFSHHQTRRKGGVCCENCSVFVQKCSQRQQRPVISPVAHSDCVALW
ncbi:unnamed protein product [Pocillopora meandrina]|uniref:Integrase catalytic domain-containing protein n=1 Tax=Pocillopora meandrina TaxID=46732 RepID=A0AAU9XH91_9CNID|nr:unnamed protein product [Pocillopora meandrina]